ncbi:TPA: hypothetical protein RHY17_004171 [Escherichia coli]|nr:hypothetical protein [Escherichia coli]HDV2327262.1 hypothetical protein [Escherichia coli]
MKNLLDYKKYYPVRAYCLGLINYEDAAADEAAQVAAFREAFNNEFWDPRNRAYYRNDIVKAMRDYLQGLPTGLGIAFENYRIVELMESWGLKPCVDEYWELIARAYVDIFRNYR